MGVFHQVLLMFSLLNCSKPDILQFSSPLSTTPQSPTPLFPPALHLLFTFEFCQEQVICSVGILSPLLDLLCQNGPVWSLEVIHQYQLALLNNSSLQDWSNGAIPVRPLNRPVCSPEYTVVVLGFALFLSSQIVNSPSWGHCSQECSQPSHPWLFWKIQKGASSPLLLNPLYKKVATSEPQKPGLLVPCYVVFPTDFRVVPIQIRACQHEASWLLSVSRRKPCLLLSVQADFRRYPPQHYPPCSAR